MSVVQMTQPDVLIQVLEILKNSGEFPFNFFSYFAYILNEVFTKLISVIQGFRSEGLKDFMRRKFSQVCPDV